MSSFNFVAFLSSIPLKEKQINVTTKLYGTKPMKIPKLLSDNGLPEHRPGVSRCSSQRPDPERRPHLHIISIHPDYLRGTLPASTRWMFPARLLH